MQPCHYKLRDRKETLGDRLPADPVRIVTTSALRYELGYTNECQHMALTSVAPVLRLSV
jgi:hypothetical protein